MSNIVTLTKVLIKNNVFAFSGRKKKGKEVSTKGNAIAFGLIMLFCVASIGIPMIFSLNLILKSYDLSNLIISFVIPLGGLTSIIFGVFSIISVFYFSKDSEQLLPLPIKSSELLISKFLASLISEYFILLMFIFPVILGVGIGSGASVLYYVYSSLIFILMPVIPSVIMSIILMLSNKIFKFSKKKDLFMYIMTGLILIFAFIYSFGLEYMMSIGTSKEPMAILNGDFSSLIRISKWLFPLFNSATYSLRYCNEFLGFSSMMTFIGINVLSMVILYFVGDKLYIKGLTKDNGVNANKKVELEKVYKSNKGGCFKELLSKEWLIIKRTPVFMLNVVIINVIFPFILAISLALGFSSEGESISNLSSFINFNSPGVLFITIGIIMILCSISSPSSSAISRDGSSAAYLKSMPIGLKTQLDAKVCFSFIIDCIIIALVEIICMIALKAPSIYLLIVNIPLCLAVLITSYLSVIVDLVRPRLDWKDENEAVKQNFNVFISCLISVAMAALFIVLGILLLNSNINIYLIFTVTSVILLVLYILINIIVKKNEVKLFSKVG